MIFNPKLDAEQCIKALALYMNTQIRCDNFSIDRHAQLHALTINFVQTVIYLKKIDHLFKEETYTQEEMNALNDLTTKLVSICEDYISDALESQ